MKDERAALEAELQALIAARTIDTATERAVRGWGPEIYGWLVGVLHDEVEATDAFSVFADQLWRSLGRYDGRCSTRTWCYMLARHAAARVRGARAKGDRVPLSQAPVSAIAAQVRATTALHLRTSSKNNLSALRAQLEPDDQILLVLRVDRDLGWREIAQILLGEDADAAACDRHAAALRKRFERVKAQLRRGLAPG
jgi:RNA polymerase sigma-70 factor (ECF subfamily)